MAEKGKMASKGTTGMRGAVFKILVNWINCSIIQLVGSTRQCPRVEGEACKVVVPQKRGTSYFSFLLALQTC